MANSLYFLFPFLLSCRLNEEMIETLFMVNNTSNFTPRNNAWRQIVPSSPLEYRVLDPKKSHNIAILLRALNVTIDEVCGALREGDNPFCLMLAVPPIFCSAFPNITN